ncbi:hypothetical protein [Moritella sp. Urea-trap-13]|uniref:hypothetical protein n=1 Tax=Moritella sp. Urea-trap-13 TaxID=2058327 RepID=UPI000C34505D|nr:hypothetical protein [Moritella sp. Urea-trap-13]PKH08178.1 hypothetical protein CXF93_05745 [Moritella sp. Urea-trap-13]
MTSCKLCGDSDDLKKSHIIPRFLYRYMLNVTDGNLTQFNTTLNLWQKSNRQLKKKLFCSDCEQLLSDNELEFSNIFKQINASTDKTIFSYLELDSEALSKLEVQGYTEDEINTCLESNPIYEKISVLEYFSISYIYRELLNNSYDVPESEIILLQNFLLNKGDCSFMLHIRLHNSKPSFNMFSTAIVLDVLDDWKHYVFYLPNMQFHVALRVQGTPEHMDKTIIFPSDFFEDEIGSVELIRMAQKGSKKAANLK